MRISWTIVSIISRLTSVAIGIIQSYIILSILSQTDYGLVRIVLSIVAMAGVLQNLGISSGSTREISSAKNLTDAGKVFIGSLMVRYAMSAPIAIAIIFGAPLFAQFYNQPNIVLPLVIFGIIILLQAAQATLKSLVQGLQKFGFLFIHQIAEAISSIILLTYFLYRFEFIGYFYGQLAFVIVSVTSLIIYGMYLLWGSFEIPSRLELKSILKAVFKIGLVVYVIKIIFTQWENLGPLVLGKVTTPESTAIFSAALFIATKVVTISDAVTDVTLPKNTRIFEQDRERFKTLFQASNTKAYILIMFASLGIIFAKRELFMILDFLMQFLNKQPISIKYSESFQYVDPLVIAFWAYSHLNLLKSGISVPIFKPLQALYSYAAMLVGTIVSYLVLGAFLDPSWNFAFSMMNGALFAYVFYLLIIKKSLDFIPLSKIDIQYTIIAIVLIILSILALINHYLLLIIYILVSSYFIVKALKVNES